MARLPITFILLYLYQLVTLVDNIKFFSHFSLLLGSSHCEMLEYILEVMKQRYILNLHAQRMVGGLILVHEMFGASLSAIRLKRVWGTGWVVRGGRVPPCYTP